MSAEKYNCAHGVSKYRCSKCANPKFFCEHKRRRDVCKECKELKVGGWNLCEHDQQRSRCKKCKGVGICEHERRRVSCKKCRGTNYCKHKKIRNACDLCPERVCEHRRVRSRCPVCFSSRGYKAYKIRAEKREIGFFLTIEQFEKLVSYPCYYCGKVPATGIDRVRNAESYQMNNCVACCGECNFGKKDRDVDTFLTWIQRVYENLALDVARPILKDIDRYYYEESSSIPRLPTMAVIRETI